MYTWHYCDIVLPYRQSNFIHNTLGCWSIIIPNIINIQDNIQNSELDMICKFGYWIVQLNYVCDLDLPDMHSSLIHGTPASSGL